MNDTDTGALTLSVCPACGERTPSAGRFCVFCGARIRTDQGEIKPVTVLFADMSGFTSFSERVDPEAVRALADAAAARFGEIVRRHGGVVDKIIGDCVMATFGAATQHEDDAARGVRSALEMLEDVRANPEAYAGLAASIGVDTGDTLYAPVGPSGGYTVLGETVNAAATLQGAANAGEVFIGQATADAVADEIDVLEVEPVTVKGQSEPLRAYRAEGLRGHRTSVATRSAFVDRAMPMRRLRELWERALTERTAYLACIAGAPGIGASRLIDEFTRSLARPAVYRGHCLAYADGAAYWPFVEIIKGAADILHDDAPDDVSAKLGALLEGLGLDDLDELRTIAVAVANLVAVPATPRGTYAADRIARGELHWGIARLLELLARRQPMVVVIEDLGSAEPEVIDLVARLGSDQVRAPLLVVATGDPDIGRRHSMLIDPRRNRRLIELGPLDAEQSRTLLASIDEDLGDGEAATLIARVGGSPLLLEEAKRLMATRGISASEVPGTFEGLIDARLASISTPALIAAGTAALIGEVFWRGTLAAALGEDPGEVLDELERHDLIRPAVGTTIGGEQEFRFRHPGILAAAARTLRREDRHRAHARIGAWVGGLPGGERAYATFAAYHLEQACAYDDPVAPDPASAARALDALSTAASAAENRDGHDEAERLYARGRTIAARAHPGRAPRFGLRRAERLTQLGRLDEAIALLDGVLADPLRDDATADQARASLGMAIATTDPARARALAASIDAEGEVALDRALLMGGLEAGAGNTAAARAALDRAVALAEERGERAARIRAHQQRAWAALHAGKLAAMQEDLRAAATLARAEGSLAAELAATWVMAEALYYTGPRSTCETLARRALDWTERLPDVVIEVRMHQRLAAIALSRGDIGDAERHQRMAVARARATGGALSADATRRLVQILLRQGRIKDAERTARVVRSATGEDADAAADLGLMDAFLAAAHGDTGATERFAEAVAALTGDPVAQTEARMLYGRALAFLDDPDGARAQWEQARAAFAAMEAHAMVEDLDALLEPREATGT